MQRIPVRSSSIRSAGYEKSSATLEVEFNHGQSTNTLMSLWSTTMHS